MVFELTADEEQRVEDLVVAFGFLRESATQQVMLEAGYPVECDVIPVDAVCVTCGRPIGSGGRVFFQDGSPKAYCERDAELEIRRLTGGRT